MQYFCLCGILPFSKSYPGIKSTWPTAKCRGRKSCDTWYYIVTCATLCVSFSSKSKAINVFSKHILKSKACDKSIQARKKLFCHVIVKNYLWFVQHFVKDLDQNWKHMEVGNQGTDTPADFTAPWYNRQKQPPEVLYKKAILKNFEISTGNTCVGVYF